jgi:hypothetical protein
MKVPSSLTVDPYRAFSYGTNFVQQHASQLKGESK